MTATTLGDLLALLFLNVFSVLVALYVLRRLLGWHRYGLTLALGILAVLSWAAHIYTGWVTFVAEQREHGSSAEVWGKNGYAWQWTRDSYENLTSEFWQLLGFVFLAAGLYHKGSPQSKEQEDRIEALVRYQIKRMGVDPDAIAGEDGRGGKL